MTTWRLFPLLALAVSPVTLVADGGTVITVGTGEELDLSGKTDDDYKNASLKLGGTVKRTAGDARYHFFDNGVELTGTATINNTVRTGFAYGSTFDMNGYKLTRTGWGNDGWFFFNDTTFVDPGDIDHKSGYLAFQGRIQGTSSAKTLNSSGGIMFSNVAASDPLAFKFNVAADSSLTVVGGQATTQEGDYNVMTGELVVGAGKKLSVDVRANTFVTFGTKTTNNGTIEKNGDGTMILGGTVALANSRYDVKAGCLRIGGDPTASSFVRYVYVTGGLLEFLNAGFVQHDNNQVGTAQVASTSPANPARLVIGSGTVFNGVTPYTTTRLLTGLSSGGYGMAELLAGGVQTNCMTVGYQGYGAFLQRGGKLYWKGMDTPTRDCIGYDAGAYGYVGIDGGSSEIAGRLWTGWKAGSTGIIVQRGGTVTANGNANGESVHFGNGRSVYALLGGTFNGKLKLSVENTEATAVDSSSAFVVSGTDTVATVSGYLASWVKNPYTTICCLRDGGRLKSHRIAHVCRRSCADSKFYLGFEEACFSRSRPGGISIRMTARTIRRPSLSMMEVASLIRARASTSRGSWLVEH